MFPQGCCRRTRPPAKQRQFHPLHPRLDLVHRDVGDADPHRQLPLAAASLFPQPPQAAGGSAAKPGQL